MIPSKPFAAAVVVLAVVVLAPGLDAGGQEVRARKTEDEHLREAPVTRRKAS